MDLQAENPPRTWEAWDLLATRLRGIVHVARGGSWEVAEALQTDAGRDTGLVSAVELYRAKKEACLTRGTERDGDLFADDEGGDWERGPAKNQNRRRPGGRNRNRKKKKGGQGDGD